MQRPEYRAADARSRNRDALNAEIDRYTVKRASGEWIDAFNDAGVPCGPIYSIDQVYADPQVVRLGIAHKVRKKDRHLPMARQPVSLSPNPSKLEAPPPDLLQHTDAILIEI